MQVYKDGIEKTIRDCDWQRYRELGYVEVGGKVEEPQPAQENIEIEDEYTVRPVKVKTTKKNTKRGK
jgi:hypothetical protein